MTHRPSRPSQTKPFPRNRRRKSGGRTHNLLHAQTELRLAARAKLEVLAGNYDAESVLARAVGRAGYFLRTAKVRHAYIAHLGKMVYCQECGTRHLIQRTIFSTKGIDALYCPACADRMGLIYYTSATYTTGDYYRFDWAQ